MKFSKVLPTLILVFVCTICTFAQSPVGKWILKMDGDEDAGKYKNKDIAVIEFKEAEDRIAFVIIASFLCPAAARRYSSDDSCSGRERPRSPTTASRSHGGRRMPREPSEPGSNHGKAPDDNSLEPTWMEPIMDTELLMLLMLHLHCCCRCCV